MFRVFQRPEIKHIFKKILNHEPGISFKIFILGLHLNYYFLTELRDNIDKRELWYLLCTFILSHI